MSADHLPYRPPPDHGLPLLYEDQDLLVLNKPGGLLSVPGRGEHKQDCMASRVQARYPEARVVHRLDLETSGILLMARHQDAQRRLGRLFEQRRVHKVYEAVVAGLLDHTEGLIDLPMRCDWPKRPRQMIDLLHGRPALTRYRLVSLDPDAGTSRLNLMPVTGRSHQLRLHLLKLGHPILGDRLYAPPSVRARAPRLLLHARELVLEHPGSGKSMMFSCAAEF